MKYFSFILSFALITFGVMNTAISSENIQKIDFNYAQTGTTYHLARAALGKKIFPLELDINRKIILFTARQDLNNDDIPELIVKIADKKYFCDSDKGCETFIFAVTSKGTEQIGSFIANDVYIDAKSYNNVKRLQVKQDNEDSFEEYVWRDGQFVAYNREG